MGFFHWLWIARPLKVMSIVSFSLVNLIFSSVIRRSVVYCLLRVDCLFDLLHLCSRRCAGLSSSTMTGGYGQRTQRGHRGERLRPVALARDVSLRSLTACRSPA